MKEKLLRALRKSKEQVRDRKPFFIQIFNGIIFVIFACVALFPQLLVYSFFIAAILGIFVTLNIVNFGRTFAAAMRELDELKLPESFLFPTLSARILRDRDEAFAEIAAGGAIVLREHPHLNYALHDNGWCPTEITIQKEDKLEPLTSAPYESLIQGDPNNGQKYSVRKLPPPMMDALKKIQISVCQTDFITTRAAAKWATKNPERRRDFISCDINKNTLPHSLCFHAICEFSDGSLLAMKRSDESEYYPGALAVSFEEQIDERDFRSTSEEDTDAFAVTNWVHRALCEEVFPLKTTYQQSSAIAWNQIDQYVDFARIWMFFLEEEIGNVSCLGYIKLNLSPEEYVKAYWSISKQFNDKIDNEGIRYLLTQDNAKSIIKNEEANIKKLMIGQSTALDGNPNKFFGPEVIVEPTDLRETIHRSMHPTSRLRLVSWAAAHRLL